MTTIEVRVQFPFIAHELPEFDFDQLVKIVKESDSVHSLEGRFKEITQLEPPVRIELTTFRLQGGCSTTELGRRMANCESARGVIMTREVG